MLICLSEYNPVKKTIENNVYVKNKDKKKSCKYNNYVINNQLVFNYINSIIYNGESIT